MTKRTIQTPYQRLLAEAEKDDRGRIRSLQRRIVVAVLCGLGLCIAGSLQPVLGWPPSHAQVQEIIAQSASDYAPKGWSVKSFRSALAHIIWIESRDCVDLEGDHGTAFGCGQTHMGAVVQVVGAPVPPWLLIVNNVFSIRVAAGYLAYCFRCMGTALGASSCYNEGCAGKFNAAYAYAVMK